MYRHYYSFFVNYVSDYFNVAVAMYFENASSPLYH